MKRAIDKLRELVREERYKISVHANEEMSSDELAAIDVESAVLTGKITRDLRKTREGHGMKSPVKRWTAGRLQLFVGFVVTVGLE